MAYDELPWQDVKKWKPGAWYPLAVGSMWTNPKHGTFHEGYNLYMQDPEATEDLIPVGEDEPMTFKQAISICEAHNGWKFNLV